MYKGKAWQFVVQLTPKQGLNIKDTVALEAHVYSILQFLGIEHWRVIGASSDHAPA